VPGVAPAATERTLLGVLGWPVAHSRSPAMQEAALRAAGLPGWRYLRLPVPPALLAETVAALGPAGFVGANATIPHKQAALEAADEASPLARRIGAANTLSFTPEGAVRADNTDAPGLIAALPASHAPAGRTALVLGAGGSARAAVCALLDAGAADVMVWNRTAARAQALCEALGGRPVLVPEPAELIVNCTSIGLDGDGRTFKALPVEADSWDAGTCVVDLVYRDGGTALLAAARARDATVVDGLEVLVAQGAESFERWTGQRAPRDTMREAVTSD